MIKLYNDDCLNVIKDIPDNSIDLIVTDPPYHIIKQGSGMLHGILDTEKNKNASKGKIFENNDIEFKEWLPELYRVAKDKTHIYLYISPAKLTELLETSKKAGFKYQQLIVWNKGNSVFNRYYMNSYELILMLRKGNAKDIKNMGTKNLISINNPRNKLHPTEKPVELNKILIENSSDEGQTVLDLFMGSGSTGVACKESHRNFIGIEIDKKYFDIASERINHTGQQTTIEDFINE